MKKLTITLIVAAWISIFLHSTVFACETINYVASEAELAAARVNHPGIDDYDLRDIINKDKEAKAKACLQKHREFLPKLKEYESDIKSTFSSDDSSKGGIHVSSDGKEVQIKDYNCFSHNCKPLTKEQDKLANKVKNYINTHYKEMNNNSFFGFDVYL